MSGLHFLMVTTFYPPYHFGGDAVFVQRLSRALVRRGHRVDVVHDADAFRLLAAREPAGESPEPDGLTVHTLASRFPWASCLATHQTGRPLVHGRRLRSLLEDPRFDVVMFHNVSLVGGPECLAWGDALKLYMAHEHWLVCPTHVLWRHDREPCDRRECLRCLAHHRRPPQLWRTTGLLERRLAHVDALISPSAFSAAKHREFGLARDLEVIPYFLPDPAAAPATGSDEEAGGRPYFLFVGRLEKLKGLQDVLPHFRGPGEAELLVVGRGGFEEELERRAAGCRVRFLGFKTPGELRSLYRGARAVVVPSLCFETFGIVILEAFREGTPVIARDLGPFTEIVQGSGGGHLFGSDEELGASLARLAGDRDLRARLGAAGRRALEEKWVERAAVPRYLDLVRRVAERRGRPEVARRATGESTQADRESIDE